MLRRLAAVTYDSLLLAAVLFFATALVLPLNGGRAFAPGQWYYPAYLLLVSFGFFAWFWTHGGQTLGMRSWKIKLVAADGGAVNWKQAGIRFAVALLSWLALGLGFWWVLWSRDRCAWHDRCSNTRLLRQPATR